MSKLNYKLEGADDLIKKLSKLGGKAVKGVEMETQASASEIAGDAKRRAPVNIGKLQQNIFPKKIGDLTYAVFAATPYAAYVEFGTGQKVRVPTELKSLAARFKGGKKGSFKQGLQSIKDWCRNKGIPEEAAYPIFVKILDEGISPQPFLWPSYKAQIPNYIKRLKALLKRYTNE